AGDIPERQIVLKCRKIDGARTVRVGEQGLQLGGERQCASAVTIVERLFARTIAGENETVLLPGVQPEREHTGNPAQSLRTPSPVRLEQDLRIARALELMTALLELSAQLAVVVDLTVQDDAAPACRVVHRLVATWGEIDDRQSAMRQR